MSAPHFAQLSQIQGVIFDLDGTLVGSSLNFAQIKAEINCPPTHDTLEFIERLGDDAQRRQALEIVLRHEMQDAQNAKWLPGARDFLTQLKKRQLPVAIVTRNCQKASHTKVKNNAIEIELILTREHFAPKPAPDALLHIAQQWQITPSALMYVGDFKYDIEAGNNAGMTSCLVTNGKDIGFEHQADLIVERLDELCPWFY